MTGTPPWLSDMHHTRTNVREEKYVCQNDALDLHSSVSFHSSMVQ